MASFESSFKQLLKSSVDKARNELECLAKDVAMETIEPGIEEVSMDVSPSGRGVKVDSGIERVKSESASTSNTITNTSSSSAGASTSNSRIQPTNEVQAEPSCDFIEPGVSDPTFPRFCLEALVMVVEYLEGMQSRLFTAQLHNEVGLSSLSLSLSLYLSISLSVTRFHFSSRILYSSI